VKGATHFSILAPTTSINVSEEEVNRLFSK
jgi:hypothetical protein